MSRGFLIALTAACLAFAPDAMAQFSTGPGASGSPNAAKTTTVKSSKSNTSDIQGQTGSTTGRMGGGGGKSKDPAKATNLNSSRSN